MNEQVMKMIETLAVKLGTTGEHLWTVLVKQAYVNSWICIIGLSIGWIITVILCTITYKNSKKDSNFSDRYSMIILFLTILFSVTIVVTTCVSFPDIITGFVNPEYWAFSKLTSLLLVAKGK